MIEKECFPVQQVDIHDAVLSFMSEVCNVERSQLHQNTALAELGFDSLSAAALTFRIESELGVELTQEDVVSLYQAGDVNDVIAMVRQLVVE
jgi:acyl carrier protein